MFLRKKLERSREYKKKNKDSIKEYNKSYKAEHKEEISSYNKEYNLNNRNIIQERINIKHKERRNNDINYGISENLRRNFNKFFTRNYKDSSSLISKLVGCSSAKYREWIEFNFDSNMCWENYGSYWQIDHVICINYFDLINENNQYICFNWKNTRPLSKELNLRKKTINNLQDIINHEIKIHFFNKLNNSGYTNIKINFLYLTTKLLEKSR
jgi:hypothetical protein